MMIGSMTPLEGEDSMKRESLLKNEDGSVLIVALIFLVLLTGIGISSSTTTEIDLRIAGNEKFHKMAFYAADGGTEAGIGLLEENIETRGFSSSTVGTATVYDLEFYSNVESSTESDNIPSSSNRDAEIPNLNSSSVYLKIYGDTELSTGSALQLAAGYEGKGKGIGGGGAFLVYHIRSCANGPANSLSRVAQRWRHLI
jgi:hypothetical protein